MITVQRIIAFRDSHPTWDFISQLWNLRSHLSTKIHLTTGGLNQICWAPPICIQHHLEIDMQYMLLCIHNSFNYQKVQILWSTINKRLWSEWSLNTKEMSKKNKKKKIKGQIVIITAIILFVWIKMVKQCWLTWKSGGFAVQHPIQLLFLTANY